MKIYQMNLAELLDGLVMDAYLDCNPLIIDMTNDSREVKPGSLFLAIPGYTFDGRDFIEAAIANGAAAILYQPAENRWFQTIDRSIPLIPIADLAKKQGEIAAKFYHQPSADMKIIGVTGTNGKTSVTQFIAQALAPEIKCALMGTLGVGCLPKLQRANLTTADAITLQKNLAKLRDQGVEAVAMEVSSHALAQHRVAGIQFDIAVFTQLSRDHLDFHGTMQRYAAAKAKLFAHTGLSHRIINYDDELGRKLLQEYAHATGLIGYSISPHANKLEDLVPTVAALQTQATAQGYIATVHTPWGQDELISPFLGRFNLSNLLAVLSVLGIFNVPLAVALSRLAHLEMVPGRLQCFGGASQQPLVIVDYAHTPDALNKVLNTLREHCRGQLWCVFGCGGDRDIGKRAKMGQVAEQSSDQVVITNDNPRHESPQKIVADICRGLTKPDQATIIFDRSQAIHFAVQSAAINDIVLIAGKGHEDYQILGDNIISFSDRAQVIEQLEFRKRGK